METKIKMNDKNIATNIVQTNSEKHDLPPAAQRALKEAEERRKNARENAAQKEVGGRGGKDPSRYGDWEIKGRAIDF